MALIVGLLLIILGTVALCVWLAEVIVFLKGIVVFSLLFWGVLSFIVGYAGWKAKRQLKTALSGEDAIAEESDSPTLLSDETPPPAA